MINRKLTVAGMTCKHCASAVADSLTSIPGLTKADADYKKGVVKIYMEREIPDELIRNAIADSGYELKEAL